MALFRSLKNEWMSECLTTSQHEKQIGYWVSEKAEEWRFNDMLLEEEKNKNCFVLPSSSYYIRLFILTSGLWMLLDLC